MEAGNDDTKWQRDLIGIDGIEYATSHQTSPLLVSWLRCRSAEEGFALRSNVRSLSSRDLRELTYTFT